MQFEQLNAFDAPYMNQLRYRTLDNDGKVYCKIDWLTAIFFDCSMNDVLRWLNLGDCVSDFCAGAYQQSRGYDDVFKFMYNGIIVETSSYNFYGCDMDVGIFDSICQKIRLDISGSGLDFLRSTGIYMEDHRFVAPMFSSPAGQYHFTRCDFAFDFINYKADFVDRMLDHINSNRLPSERVPLFSTKGAISCKVVTGGQKTIYLGSPQSDRMLRVYDKRMQYVDLNSGVYKKPNPYGNPESWFRIEWQTRNRFANDLVQDPQIEFKHILKMIFEKYAFADGAMDARRSARRAVDFWNDLFDWSDLETRIIQNQNFV